MKVLHVITDLQTGGVPLHLLRLATYLQGQGLTLQVVSLAPPGPVSQRLQDRGIPTQSCQTRGRWDWSVIGRLGAIIRDFGPELIHSLLFHANFAARLAARRVGFDSRKLICEIQTVETERRWHLLLDRWSQRLCRVIVCNSPSVVEHLAIRGRIDCSRLRLIWGGVDLELFQEAGPMPSSELGVPDGVPLLLWVGRLDPIKGLDVLLRALELSHPSMPAHLLIAGEGAYRQTLEGLILRSAVVDRVHLLGVRVDVPQLLKTADVFVFPSRAEGLPNALLEAMAAGLPIVATDAPGARDLIRNEVTGLLVPIDDPAALARAIDRLLLDRGLASVLGLRAADYVAANHPQERCFAEYLALYQEAMGDPASALA